MAGMPVTASCISHHLFLSLMTLMVTVTLCGELAGTVAGPV